MRTLMRFCCIVLVVTVSMVAGLAQDIVVTVTDGGGALLPGVSVHVLANMDEYLTCHAPCEPYEPFAEGVTKADGIFSCSLQPKRSYLIVTRADGFGVVWSRISIRNDRDALEIGQITQRLTLPAEIQIRGHVVDASGNAVGGATVGPYMGFGYLRGDSLGRIDSILSTRTNADGAFLLKNIPKGAWVSLVVSHPDYATTFHHVDRLGALASPRAEEAVEMTVVMERGYTITGKIRYEQTGTPAAGAIVQTVADLNVPGKGTPSWVETAMADEDGNYALHVNPPKRGHSVRDKSYRWTESYTLHARNPNSPPGVKPVTLKLEIPEETSSAGNDFRIPEAMLVSGRFVNAETHEPISASNLHVTGVTGVGDTPVAVPPEGSTRSWEVKIESGGSFAFHVMPGWLVLKGSCVFDSYEIPFWKDLSPAGGAPRTGLVLEVGPPTLLKGNVIGPDRKGVVRATVMASTSGFLPRVFDKQRFVETDDDGSFRIPLEWVVKPESLEKYLQGESSLTVSLEAYRDGEPNFYGDVSRPFAPPQADSPRRNKLSAVTEPEWKIPATPFKWEIATAKKGVVRGRVLDRKGKAIAGALVLAGHGPTELDGRNIATDNDGRYVLRGLDGDVPYVVSAQAHDSYGRLRDTCSVPAGEVVELPDIIVPSSYRSIAGTVTDTRGNPLADMMVLGKDGKSQARWTRTDTAGHFKLTEVLDGYATIEAFDERPNSTMVGSTTVPPFQDNVTIVVKAR